jgi:hypothetical protein
MIGMVKDVAHVIAYNLMWFSGVIVDAVNTAYITIFIYIAMVIQAHRSTHFDIYHDSHTLMFTAKWFIDNTKALSWVFILQMAYTTFLWMTEASSVDIALERFTAEQLVGSMIGTLIVASWIALFLIVILSKLIFGDRDFAVNEWVVYRKKDRDEHIQIQSIDGSDAQCYVSVRSGGGYHTVIPLKDLKRKLWS